MGIIRRHRTTGIRAGLTAPNTDVIVTLDDRKALRRPQDLPVPLLRL